MNDMSLTGRIALVTGASRGIGLETVRTFAHKGCRVLAGVRQDTKELATTYKEWSEQYEVSIDMVHVDLSSADSAVACARELAKTEGLQILVNNAGVASGSPFQMTSMTEFREMFEINFFATVALTQTLSRRLSRTGNASIVNIGSTAGLNGDVGTSAYGSSKAALMYLTRVMAIELGRVGIRANAVAPTVTSTDMYDQMSEESRDALIQGGAIKRAATASDVAETVAFLAGDGAAMITGQIIRVDGGQRGR